MENTRFDIASFSIGLVLSAASAYLLYEWASDHPPEFIYVLYFFGGMLLGVMGAAFFLLAYKSTSIHRYLVVAVAEPFNNKWGEIKKKWRENETRWFVRYPLGLLPAYIGYYLLANDSAWYFAIVPLLFVLFYMWELALIAIGIFAATQIFGVLQSLSRIEGLLIVIILMLGFIIYDSQKRR